MTDNANFVKEMERHLKILHGEIFKFRVMAEVADPDDQIEYYHIIEEILAKDQAVREKLIAYDASDEVDRSTLKNEIDELYRLLEEAIESAIIRIN